MKHALVLSGGNTKGCYQAGALKKFEEKGIKFDSLYGVSVGAVNALGWAYGDAKKLCDVWLSLRDQKDVISKEPWYKFFLNVFPQYNMDPLRKKLTEYVGDLAPKCRAVVAYVDLKDGNLCHADNLKLDPEAFIHWVIASASEPPAVKPLEGRYFDGGIRDQTPLKKAIDDGNEKIWVVLNSNPHFKMDLWESKWPHAWQAIFRTVDIIGNEIFINDIHRCLSYNHIEGMKKIELRYIFPDKKLKGGFEVDPAGIQEAINMGYKDAEHFFK